MSNDSESVWQELTGTHPELELQDWATINTIHGESEEPGITQKIIQLRGLSDLTGTEDSIQAVWTLYYGVDRGLQGAYLSHVVDEIHKPIFLIIHPDHQREGLATKIIDYIVSKYEEEHGVEFPHNESWGTMVPSFLTAATANFANKYVNSKLVSPTE